MKTRAICLLLSIILFAQCSKDSSDDPTPPKVTKPDPPSPSENEPIPVITSSLQACENGFAGEYPCSNYDLVNRVPLSTLGVTAVNDNWGWKDPVSNKEYVLQGLDDGVAFLDISDPGAVRYIGKLPTTTTSTNTWRDVKVYNNHAFIVSEAREHGLQVFDLTRLRDQTNFQRFTTDAHLTSFGNAHNIAINENSGFAYVIGANRYSGGPLFIDINNPTQPIEAGGYAGSSYTHDAQIVTYAGPDPDYQGRELLFGSNSDNGENNQVIVVDVTDKSAPKLISFITYSNGGYTHQGWIDEAHRYFYLGDEYDEQRYGNRTRTLVFDMSDLDKLSLHHEYEATTNSIDHNGYVKGDSFYLASYTAGFREIDISDIENKQMKEIGFFDTYPQDDRAIFEGVWNVYPFFESEIIAVSDFDRGLFLVKKSN